MVSFYIAGQISFHDYTLRIIKPISHSKSTSPPLQEDTSKLVHTLTQALSESSLPLVSISRGLEPGQLLVSLKTLPVLTELYL